VLDSHILGFTLWEVGHTLDGSGDVEDELANVLREFPAA
jgi:hypothetical protein